MGNSSSIVKGNKGDKVEKPKKTLQVPNSAASLSSDRPASDASEKPDQVPTDTPGQASKDSVPSVPHNESPAAEDIRDKYELGDVLGSGSFGQVLQVRVKASPSKIRAVKIIERDEQDEAENDWSVSALFRKEVGLLQTFDHPNIVQFWDFYQDKDFLYVVMDLCRGGEIFDMVIALKRFTEADAAVLGAQMLAAIDYIHKLHIMHRDIKAENFLLAEKSPTATVKMIDFGMAVKFTPGEQCHDLCGSPHYLAPELVGQKYNHMVDIWAFGVLMYLMMYGHYPFDADSTKAIMVKIITGTIKWNSHVRLAYTTVHFLQRVLVAKPKRRVNAELALQDEWILAAGNPDPELERELTEKNLTENVRSAQRKLSSSRREVDPSVAKSRSDKLQKLAKDFEKGIRHGARLGDTPKEEFMSKPEFVRRKNRLVTAPGLQIRQTVKSLAASAQAKMQAVRKGSMGGKKAPSSKLKYNSVMPAPPEEAPAQLVPSGSCSPQGRPSSSQGGVSSPFESSEVRQATSMRGGMIYIGKLHSEEIKIFKKTWEEWKQESEQKNAEICLGSSNTSRQKRVSTEECVLTVQAEMERAVAKQHLEPDLSARMPSTVKEVPEELRADLEDRPLPMGEPHQLLDEDSYGALGPMFTTERTCRGVTPQNGIQAGEIHESRQERSAGRRKSNGLNKSKPPKSNGESLTKVSSPKSEQ